MTSDDIASEVDAHFASYVAAFERFDVAGLASHFVYPCHITADGETVASLTMARPQDYVATIDKFLGLYRAAGVGSGRIVVRTLKELSPRLALATVRWEVRDGGGAALYDFDAHYALARTNEGWRFTAIAHNEMPRLLALRLKRRENGA